MFQGTLNGYNYTDFGLYILSGMADFIVLPKRKESVSHNWPEETGIDIDLADPHFEAREFRLSCLMKANSRADFYSKNSALFTQLKQPGVITLFFADLNATFHVFFKEQQGLRKYTKSLASSTNVQVQFDLVFGETDPNDNYEDVYIVTDEDEFIIA